MQLVAVLILAGTLSFVATPVAHAEQETGLSVVGEGRVITSPDLARVVFGVERFEPSLARALEDASHAMEAVIERLVALGVNRDDVKTIRFSVSPIYDGRGENPALRGYRVTNAVSATIRGLDRVGGIIDEAVGAGATRVEGVAFDTSRLPELKDEAREQAMANARGKADQLARLAGVTLGRPILIEESDPSGAPPVRQTAAPAAPAPEATPIEGGQLEIRTVVRVVWQIG
jgi:uncharacterized protein YggE